MAISYCWECEKWENETDAETCRGKGHDVTRYKENFDHITKKWKCALCDELSGSVYTFIDKEGKEVDLDCTCWRIMFLLREQYSLDELRTIIAQKGKDKIWKQLMKL